MFDISQKVEDKLVLGETEYQLFLSFDRVLWVFKMWRKSYIPDEMKPKLALAKLTGVETFKDLDVVTAMQAFEDVFTNHIQTLKESDEAVQYDIEGNVMPTKPKENSDREGTPYSLFYDGEYIFSSFMQAYGIDLIEEQGRLHWKKFNALLAGLPEGTKFVEVLKIRSWKPQKGDTAKERRRMQELQKEYALPSED